jgi:MoaA/NifB/PqqE/SkfB family radical SAM enzyme
MGAHLFDGRVPFPAFASIETTMYCNLQCPMCIQFLNGTTVSGPHMELEAFEAVAKAVFPFVDRFQPSVSGEPLMSRGLERMLEVARQHEVRVEYFTNGTLLNDRMVALVLPTLDSMSISFDGATKATFEQQRAGARYETVLANVRRVVQAVRALGPGRPPIGFAVTLMEGNVRELPALVELAHELGADFVGTTHVMPVTEAIRQQSLARHPELAREWIGKAAARARELGVPLDVRPLDRMVESVATAASGATRFERALATEDGHVEGLGLVHVSGEPAPERRSQKPLPHKSARRERPELWPSPPLPQAQLPSSIYTCEYLWNKLYVGHEGAAFTCCMPGNPVVGNLRDQPLTEIWDGPIYRAMRERLAHKQPAPVCRGCQYVEEVTDPERIRALLQGRALSTAPFPALPVALRPLIVPERVPDQGELHSVESPAIEWSAAQDAEGYELQVSTDDFQTVAFTTEWHGGLLPGPRYRFPDWAWAQLPAGQGASWRVAAVLPETRAVVARGRIAKTALATPAPRQ